MNRDLLRSVRISRGLSALSLALAAACAPSAEAVTQGTASGTGCSEQDLLVFNYDKKSRNWLAACSGRVFVCSPGRTTANCVEQAPETVDPALSERIQALTLVPLPQRGLFVHYDVSSQDWDGFAKTVASVARLRQSQVQEIEHPTRLHTEFSPEFNTALVNCLGAEGVARVDVSPSGGLTVAPSKPCLMALRGVPDMNALRERPNQSFYLAAGVYAVQPIERPGTEADEAEASALEIAVRDWLDGSASDILACTNTERAVVSVRVDEDGKARVSLREELAETVADGCVQSALPKDQIFEGGPGEVVHLVRPQAPPISAEPEETVPEEPKREGKSRKP